LIGIIPSLTNPNTLIKLTIDVRGMFIPLSFLTKFANLQEFEITYYFDDAENFKALRYVTLPQLQILKCEKNYDGNNTNLIKFLEINGKNLKEISFDSIGHYSDLTITKFFK